MNENPEQLSFLIEGLNDSLNGCSINWNERRN